MKKTTGALLSMVLFTSLVSADNLKIKLDASAKQSLMTARDVINNTYSNISIQNKTGSAITVTGLYINQYASTSTDCTSPTVLYTATYPAAAAAGAFVTPVPLSTNQSAPIGQNYLYNMLYTAMYYESQVSNSVLCWLPGCTWAGDASPAEKWCVYLGVMAPASNNTATTANAPPFAAAVNGTGYNYDLVTQYGYIGPITCDDQTLTCSVATAQSVPFPQ